MPKKKDFQELIELILNTASQDNKRSVELNALELHKVFGYLPDGSHRTPQCCNAMREVAKVYDSEVVSEHDRDSTKFTIKFYLF